MNKLIFWIAGEVEQFRNFDTVYSFLAQIMMKDRENHFKCLVTFNYHIVNNNKLMRQNNFSISFAALWICETNFLIDTFYSKIELLTVLGKNSEHCICFIACRGVHLMMKGHIGTILGNLWTFNYRTRHNDTINSN